MSTRVQLGLSTGERLHFAMENHMFFMGKSTISTGPCSIAFCMFTRGYLDNHAYVALHNITLQYLYITLH